MGWAGCLSISLISIERMAEQSLNVSKRLRPEDTALSPDPNAKFVQSRLLLNKSEFSQIIGKGGQMISSIRAMCGAGVYLRSFCFGDYASDSVVLCCA